MNSLLKSKNAIMNYSKGAIFIGIRNFPCNSGNLGRQGRSLVKDPLDYHMVRGIASLVDQERLRKIYLFVFFLAKKGLYIFVRLQIDMHSLIAS